jgi:hypothetical protein
MRRNIVPESKRFFIAGKSLPLSVVEGNLARAVCPLPGMPLKPPRT